MRVGVWLVLVLVACKHDAPAPQVVFGAGECSALACATVEGGATIAVTLRGDDLVVTGDHLPDGASIAPARIAIGGVLHKLTIRQTIGADAIDFGQHLTVTLPGKPPAIVALPPFTLGKQLVARLATITIEPVVFANEAAPPQRHTAVLAEPSDNIVFGPAKLAEDIDWIAVPSDTALTIYERRTGKVVETKAFAAAPDRNVMKAWLAERVTEP